MVRTQGLKKLTMLSFFLVKKLLIWRTYVMKKYEILITPEFEDWENSHTKKEQIQIDDRLDMIRTEGHF